MSANFIEISFPFEYEYDTNKEKSSQKSSQKILELMNEDPYITTSIIAERLNISLRAVAKQIATLKEKN